MGSSSNCRNSSSSHGDGEILKPLVKGWVTGQLHALFVYWNRSMLEEAPNFKKKLSPFKHIPKKTLLKMDLVYGSICTTASLGIFEISSQRVRDGNEGMPLTLSQEAGCGFLAGSLATLASHPLVIARHRVGLENLSIRNWFTHISLNQTSMWKCASIPKRIGFYMGMVASHDRTLNYLNHQSFPFWTAQIGAGVAFGFFATACYHCVAAVQGSRGMQMAHIRPVISRLLRDVNLQNHILNGFRYTAHFCVVQYAIYEGVGRMEWMK